MNPAKDEQNMKSPNSNQWQEAKRLLNAALDQPPAEREAFVRGACGENAPLLAEVLTLLAAHRTDDLDTTTVSAGTPLTEKAGTVIGRYRLLQQIGEGGFGVVFLAEQRSPVHRKVALKIIKLGMDTREVVARFEAERQALALMDHPHIARVFDGGATESGRPYFVMEYVMGDPITEFADAHRLNVRARLELLTQACHAVQHAHQKGIIHRDIKPRNVLVSMVDGRPYAKVIDFGIAKATAARLTERTLFTEHRQLIGTPEYMSPEQAEGSPDIDTRTDVYALGVLLYELLSGVTPFDAKRLRSAGYGELQRIIREEEPSAPSMRLTRNLASLAATAAARHSDATTLGSQIRGELDWIALKALEKDRARRYESASDLGEDLQRHLKGEPVVAAPPTWRYRLRKIVRRHRAIAMAGAVVATALLLGLAGTSWQWWRAEHANSSLSDSLTAERAAREDAEWNAYATNIALAQAAIAAGDWPAARERLANCAPERRGFEWHLLNEEAGIFVSEIPDSAFLRHSADCQLIAIDLHGGTLLLDGSGNPIGEPIRGEAIYGGSFAASQVLTRNGYFIRARDGDGRLLWEVEDNWKSGSSKMTVSADGQYSLAGDSKSIQLRNRNGQAIGKRIDANGTFRDIVFSPNNQRFLIWDDKGIQLRNMQCETVGTLLSLEEEISTAKFSPTGEHVVAANARMFQIWDSDGEAVSALTRFVEPYFGAQFSPDGSRILTGSSGKAQLWDTRGMAVGRPLEIKNQLGIDAYHRKFAWGIGDYDREFNCSGSRVLLHAVDGARIWNAYGDPSADELADVKGAGFSPDGMRWATRHQYGVQSWNLEGQAIGDFMRHEEFVHGMKFSPDGNSIMTLADDNTIRLWNRDGVLKSVLPIRHRDWFNIYPDNVELLASAEGKTRVLIHPNGDMHVSLVLNLRESVRTTLHADSRIRAMELEMFRSGTGRHAADRAHCVRRMVIPDGERRIRILTENDCEVAVFDVPQRFSSVEFAPDGERLIISYQDKSVEVWDARSPERRAAIHAERYAARAGVREWVANLLAGPAPIADVRNTILEDSARTPLERLAALDELSAQLALFERMAQSVFVELRSREGTPNRVRESAARFDGAPRFKEALKNIAEEWRPDSSELNDYAWRIVQSVHASSRELTAALSAAEEASRLAPNDINVRDTLGVAQYRCGQFEAAMITLSESTAAQAKRDGNPPTSGLAFGAMANFKLGRVEAARALLKQLRELPTKGFPFNEANYSNWLCEAEELIEGSAATSQPAQAP